MYPGLPAGVSRAHAVERTPDGGTRNRPGRTLLTCGRAMHPFESPSLGGHVPVPLRVIGIRYGGVGSLSVYGIRDEGYECMAVLPDGRAHIRACGGGGEAVKLVRSVGGSCPRTCGGS